MKRLLSLLLVMAMMFAVIPATGETVSAEDTEIREEQVESRDEAEDYFSLPVRFGIVQSVVIYNDKVSVVLNLPMAGEVAMGLDALYGIADLKEVRFRMGDGTDIILPLFVEIEKTKAGAFITLNISMDIIQNAAELIRNKDSVKSIAFVQNNLTEYSINVEEIGQALNKALGSLADLVSQATEALSAFRKGLVKELGWLALKAYVNTQDALSQAGDFVSQIWTGTEEKISGATESAGGAISNALDSTGKLFEDAANKARELWKNLRERNAETN